MDKSAACSELCRHCSRVAAFELQTDTKCPGLAINWITTRANVRESGGARMCHESSLCTAGQGAGETLRMRAIQKRREQSRRLRSWRPCLPQSDRILHEIQFVLRYAWLEREVCWGNFEQFPRIRSWRACRTAKGRDLRLVQLIPRQAHDERVSETALPWFFFNQTGAARQEKHRHRHRVCDHRYH